MKLHNLDIIQTTAAGVHLENKSREFTSAHKSNRALRMQIVRLRVHT